MSGRLVFGLSTCRSMPGQSSPATKISLFTDENARFCDPPHPPGGRAAPPYLVSAGSQTTKLSPPTLLDGSPPGFSSTGEASLPAIAGRQAKKFCFKLDTVFINSDIYIYIYIYMSGFMKTVLNTESSVFFQSPIFFCLFNYFAFAMTADSHSHLAWNVENLLPHVSLIISF